MMPSSCQSLSEIRRISCAEYWSRCVQCFMICNLPERLLQVSSNPVDTGSSSWWNLPSTHGLESLRQTSQNAAIPSTGHRDWTRRRIPNGLIHRRNNAWPRRGRATKAIRVYPHHRSLSWCCACYRRRYFRWLRFTLYNRRYRRHKSPGCL